MWRNNKKHIKYLSARRSKLCVFVISDENGVQYVHWIYVYTVLLNIILMHRCVLMWWKYTQCLKKLCIFVSVRTLSNFHEFWCVDGKVAEIVCYAYIFHLTWLTSLHYLVKLERSKFYLTPDLLESDCSDVMSKWRRHTVATTFFLRSPC